MDNQEVVREPFEADEFVRSSIDDQSPTNYDDEQQEDYDINSFNKGSQADDDNDHHHYENSGSSTTTDDDNSASFVEDANFARSFGINLKTKKCINKSNQFYDRLLKSKHLLSEQPSSSSSEVTTSAAGKGKNNTTTNQEKSNRIKTSVTTDCIYHKGTFYQKGDIVTICDLEDGQPYFAQLTGFLQDQYCEKSASINWLVPIRPTSRNFFDPSAYKIGLEDTLLRKLDCMTFVCHCPHDYYLRKFFQLNDDNQTNDGNILIGAKSAKEKSYIWTTLETCRVPNIRSNNHHLRDN